MVFNNGGMALDPWKVQLCSMLTQMSIHTNYYWYVMNGDTGVVLNNHLLVFTIGV